MKFWEALILIGFLVLGGCGKKESAAPTPTEAKSAAQPMSSNEVAMTPELAKLVRVGELPQVNVGQSIVVAAQLEADETRVTRVGSPLMGRIVSLAIREGQEVTKGQLIALLNSTGLSDAQLGYLKALSQRQLALRAMERAQLLLKADVIGAAELQRREAELAQASAELDAAVDQLTLLGMPAESIEDLRKTRALNSVARILASMDGTVLDRKITQGQIVEPADTVCEIADLSSLWLVADVPEQNAGGLMVGQAVEANVAALPGQPLVGKLSFVSATVNPGTRTVRVRMDVSNAQRRLKPAMLATMVLRDRASAQRVVPDAAIVREGNGDFVFVQIDSRHFALREVSLGMEQSGARVLVDGVKSGERVVLEGAFHLNSERRKQSIRGEGS
jgi:cobalt-zinc-cadmium efflux system membrane fusion protein